MSTSQLYKRASIPPAIMVFLRFELLYFTTWTFCRLKVKIESISFIPIILYVQASDGSRMH